MTDLVRLPRHSDPRGHLVAVTAGAEVPFPIRRAFWIYGNTDGLDRAHHASRTTTELLVSLAGSCRARLDGPKGSCEVTLDSPDSALLMPPMTWLALSQFTPDCVLLVLADAVYDPDDLISSFDEFTAARR